ncbi:WD40/YVTN/BNR-like repeat-containing protein [Flavobacterium gawalongense]|uniref:Oxidoreductase n=1 Tax=Flavobacterium gawalongense TaxID=2594432 RepID=A0ABY3CJU6_9FLAO|nr:oxidoreductase [Flavobacterium gawalongense]TRX00249.1 oxidoreductase [Flavobacterium gawalongense]TRX05366.1 oxidoreductase [Flavobacterium gawalongense]
MRNIFLIVLFLIVFMSCKTGGYVAEKLNNTSFQSIQIDTLFQDKMSIRAILIDANKVWYAADESRFGFYDLEKDKKNENRIENDSLKFEFRSIAQTSSAVFILNVSNPALLYRISKDGSEIKLVYQENHEKVFYDSMQFWNDKEGIAIGDPISDCLSILITRDGGNSWNKIPSSKLPKVTDGEAAFAASNANIVTKGDKAWVVSGGKKARVFYSPDKGKTWEVYDTPIVQGKTMTGIFTADFYDFKKGFVAGGNYEVPEQNSGNKASTTNGGKTWKLITENQGFGYASCVQYVPNSNGTGLVSVGASGLYYSSDSGNSWKQLSADSSLFTIRFMDENTAIAAGKNKMIRLNFKK